VNWKRPDAQSVTAVEILSFFLLTAISGIMCLSSSDRISSAYNCPQSHPAISEHLKLSLHELFIMITHP
jgi:hypothetical protein